MYIVDRPLPDNCLHCPFQSKCEIWVQIFDARYDLKFMDIPTPKPMQHKCCLIHKEIPRWIALLYHKWIKGECRNICIFCSHRKECKKEWLL